MKKKYFYITLLLFFFLSLSTFAQESKGSSSRVQDPIEGLNIYPNPVTSDRIYITSKSGLNKEIEIYDVLGKKILQVNLSGKELLVSSLNPGVYIIKIKEGEATATRKLIVK